MYCTACGVELREMDRFCPKCGKAASDSAPPPPPPQGPPRRLVRPMYEKSIGGVCAGVARYLEVDVTLLRILWLCAAIFFVGTGFLVYLICWIVMPPEYRPLPAAETPEPVHPQSAEPQES